jgi:hypothetical protein
VAGVHLGAVEVRRDLRQHRPSGQVGTAPNEGVGSTPRAAGEPRAPAGVGTGAERSSIPASIAWSHRVRLLGS